MKCPVCGAADLVRDTRDVPFVYRGKATIISSVTADYCPACGESVPGKAEADRMSALMLAFKRDVDESRSVR
ncbi:type II toxin-antitoxin system MqsA family antitoxin [Trinickia sp.]|uniref:type II toxin-antitoxin system MqsA family antitoxin n=1 Tax=Trinickia sp. TaxID=2571163 RepID=UPI003F820C01